MCANTMVTYWCSKSNSKRNQHLGACLELQTCVVGCMKLVDLFHEVATTSSPINKETGSNNNNKNANNNNTENENNNDNDNESDCNNGGLNCNKNESPNNNDAENNTAAVTVL